MLEVAQGGTAHITMFYRNGSGALTDPTTPTVDILDPTGVIVLPDQVPTRVSTGQYTFDYPVAGAATLGNWIARFSGVIDALTVVTDEQFKVVYPGSISDSMQGAPLASLEALKVAIGTFPNPSAPNVKDAGLNQALAVASSMVRHYTGMLFETANPSVPTSTRQFEYDGSGYMNIDECTVVNGVVTNSGYQGAQDITLTVDEWAAYPLNLPVKTWLRLPEGYVGRGISPEMGFTYNLDTIGVRSYVKPVIVTVDAVWGWPEIPYDVQQATIWTALAVAEGPQPYTQESIENYSRTKGPGADLEAIPDRAQAALAPYIVPQV